MKKNFVTMPYDNFSLWEKRIILNSYYSMIISFIDNGIMDNNQALLNEVYERYVNSYKEFYEELKRIVKLELDLNDDFEIVNYNISFTSRKYEVEFDNIEFNLKTSAMDNLQILPDYKYMLTQIIKLED